MTTYTVFDVNDSSRIFRRKLTAFQAMDEVLSYDGYRWEIRHEHRAWNLYHSDGSMNSTRGARQMVCTVVFSLAVDKAVAENEIAEAVIAAGWRGLPIVMTDQDFDQMLAKQKADAADDAE